MFKKIEIWILYLAVMFGIVACVTTAVLVRQELVGKTKFGPISAFALFMGEIPSNMKRLFKNDLVLEDRFRDLAGFDGAPALVNQYLLLSRYDGDIKQGVVELIDLRTFENLYSWNPDLDSINAGTRNEDEFLFLNRDVNDRRSRLIHPLLTADGGLLFKDNSPLRKIDECSNLIFQNDEDLFHHSIESDLEGNIWTSTHLFPQRLSPSTIGNDNPKVGGYLDDAVVKLSPAGEIIFQKSVSQILIENEMEHLLFSVGDMGFTKDPVHVNDVQPAVKDSQYWKKDDVFISLRHQSMILLYRPATNELIWKKTGDFFHQHDVDIVDDHRISIFNNNSKDFIGGDTVDGNNEILIYDFRDDEMSAYLSGSLAREDVRTVTEGQMEILANGDLFLEESNFGRTMYFNKDGTLAWSHVNRASDGNVYMVGWSRILHTETEVQMVETFLDNRGECNE